MAEIVNTEQLPDGMRLETYADGRQLVKDANNRIVKTFLPKELASSIGKIPHQNKAKLQDGSVEELLEELNLTGSSSAKLLCEQFVKGGASGVGAARVLLSMAAKTSGNDADNYGGLKKPKPGETCALCGQLVLPTGLDDIRDRLIDLLMAEKLARLQATGDKENGD